MYTYGWFTLFYGRNQLNVAKQLPSFKNKLKHKKELQAVKAMEVMGFLTPSEFISLFITRSFFIHHQHGGSEPYSSTPKGFNLGNQRSITQPNYQESFLQTVKESGKLKHEGWCITKERKFFVLFPYHFPINSAFLNDQKSYFMEENVFASSKSMLLLKKKKKRRRSWSNDEHVELQHTSPTLHWTEASLHWNCWAATNAL